MAQYQKHHDRKFHLSNLPEIKDFPKWQGYGEFACLLIPIFSLNTSTEFIEGYVAKAAAWALKTWKTNSDVKLFNIPCYIYIESTIADAAIPLLKKNRIPEDNILVAEFTNTEWLAKCLQPLFDKSFEKYEYLVISDIDMFALRSKDGEPLRLFEHIWRFKPEGYGCRIFHESIPLYWMSNLQPQPTDRKLIDVWCEKLGEFTNRDDLRQYVDGGFTDDRPWTGTTVIPKGTFKDKDWLENVCKTLADDEAVMYAWTKLSEDNQMWDIEKEMNIKLFSDFYEYLCNAFHTCLKTHKLNSMQFEDVYCLEPCLLHHYASLDYKFYKAIEVF